MLTNYDVMSVQHLIDQSDYKERDFLKAHARMEVDIIRNQCLNRTMTDKEQRAFEFALETITQLESRQEHDSASFFTSSVVN